MSAPLLAPRFLYRRANVRARADSPSVAELKAEGWTVEHVDPRYGTALMRKAEEGQRDNDDVLALLYPDAGGGDA